MMTSTTRGRRWCSAACRRRATILACRRARSQMPWIPTLTVSAFVFANSERRSLASQQLTASQTPDPLSILA